MADGTFDVSVLTPEAELLRVAAKSVVLRSSDGDLTILDGHTPLVTDVVPGEVRVHLAEGDPVHLAVHGGYLHVETGRGETGEGVRGSDGRSTVVTLLAGVAELAGSIDAARAERARVAAEERVGELRAAGAGPSPGASAPAGPSGAPGPTAGGDGTPEATPEDLELAQAEAALRRAEVRLEVAGATTGP